jgi:hypothetical protein
LRKFCPLRYRKLPGHQIDLTKIEPLQHILSLKTTKTENRERILKAIREKKTK